MNSSIASVTIDHSRESLTTWGVFIASVLLSVGGCIAMSCETFRRSRCTQMSCCGATCTRKPLAPEEIFQEIEINSRVSRDTHIGETNV